MNRKASQPNETSATTNDPDRTLVVILAALIVQQILLNLWSLLSYKDIIYVPRFWPGFDISDFLRASRDFLAGSPPYAREQFVTPPLSVFIAMPFLPFGWPAAIYAFFFVNLATIATAIVLVAHRFSIHSAREIALLAGISSLYYPAYFLLERGNIDGVAMLCAGLVIWAAGRSVAAVFIVLGASIKIYPAVLGVWFAAERQWRLLWIGAVTAVVSVALVSPLWPAFAQAIEHRSTYFTVDENASVFNFLLALAHIFHLSTVVGIIVGILLIAGFLGIHAVCDGRRHAAAEIAPQERAARIALYIPFFAASPMTVYPYTQVSFLLLLPIFMWLVQKGMASQWARACFTAGFLCTAVQANAWANFAGDSGFRLLSSLGTMLALIACAAIKWQWRPRQLLSNQS